MWSWPFGIAAVGCYFFVFLDARLIASAGLQLVFLALNLWGWWAWWQAKGDAPDLPLIRMSGSQRIASLTCLTPLVAVIFLLTRAASAAPVWDASTTAMALLAQYWQARRAVECWPLWVAVNVSSVGLYAAQHLWVASATYALLLAVALWGWREWLLAWKAQAA